jgi:outer membrane lipoprotein-sorting protein
MSITTRRRTLAFAVTCLILVAGMAPAQEILTANEYFENVASNFRSIENYVADFVWTDANGEMSGVLLYKAPNLIRIDFDDPADQWLISNGDELLVYLPRYNVVLQQELRGGSGVGALTAEGLAIMRRSYDVAYLEGPEAVPLEEGSSEMVTKLRLDRKQVTEGFREIILSIDENGYIRRLVGTMVDWAEVQMDLSGIQINQFIPDARFDEELDAAASVNENFLFDPEE